MTDTASSRHVSLVTAPHSGPAPLITHPAELRAFIASIDPAAPIAIDAERAQSFRYSSKAYLLQFHQAATGTHLVDPIALAESDGLAHLDDLSRAIAGCEWVLHAASQDLACLAEVGLVPERIFDTELAGRLLGLQRVSLSPMLTHYLGIELAKAHSADDWSRRPLPSAWLNYASLDVDFLLELRDAVAYDLEQAGKAEWARQEFSDVIQRFALPPETDPERWRGLRGLGRLHQSRELAVARALWNVRDELARESDIAPGRLVPDTAMVDAAAELARMAVADIPAKIVTLPGFKGRFCRRNRHRWSGAVVQVLAADPSKWPKRSRSRSLPAPRYWDQSYPAAAARWAAARPAVLAVAEAHSLPPQNLLTVPNLAQIVWPDDADFSEAGLRTALAEVQARPWQCDLLAPALATALRAVG